MFSKHIYSLLISIVSVLLFSFSAQSQGVMIRGKIIESKGKQPLQFVTVMVKHKNTNELITGTTSTADGSFEVESKTLEFYLEVSFIGFVSKSIQEVSVSGENANIGTIQLQEDSKILGEVSVRAEKSKTEFKLDKRVFNVGKDLSSKGASALDVLNNVPSVNVNIEGEISLRGSGGVQILINGKPSVIANENTLGTITADMIERIEVITNPSAKYDAEGTSGIINIVIKKEERKGINGSLSLNTGWPQNHSMGLSLNRRTEKFNLFTQLGAGYRSLPRYNESVNHNLTSLNKLESDGTEYRNEQFYNVILGTDYHINRNNVLTLSGSFAYEIEKQPSETNYLLYNNSNELISDWKREETSSATNPKWQYELQYKRDFEDHKKHDLVFSAQGRYFGKDLSSEFETTTISGTNNQNDQLTSTKFNEANYTFKLDYTKPFTEQITLETGAQYVIQDVSNDYQVEDWVGDKWFQNSGLTNLFEYDQKVLGVYGTGAYEGEKWGVKAGVRLENTDLKTYLANTVEENKQLYFNLFPSLHTSYKISDKVSFQAGYSKRIRRPVLWELNPFFNIRDNFNIRKGNPELKPEFTDSYELTSIFLIGEASLNIGMYHRYSTDVVEYISTSEGNVTSTGPDNIGTNKTYGAELNGKYSPTKWLVLNGDFNFNFFNREGALEGVSFNFNAEQWSSKLSAKLQLPKGLDIEVTGRYRSAIETIQGERSANLFADFGLRKKILKGRGIVNLSVRDAFASRIWENETTQDDFYLYSKSLRGRFVSLGFSYGFGKGEAMEYSGRKRRH